MKIIFSNSTSPVFNLATEKFLFGKVEDDFLFLYVNEPCVVIGRNQAVGSEVNFDFCEEYNVKIIRRISGGGAVYHDTGNLNYSFISNKKESPLSADFLLPIVAVLKSFGIPAEVGKRKDLWIDGRKVSGTASHISKGRELHHGTLLYDADLEKLQNALKSDYTNEHCKAIKSVRSPVVNIKDYLKTSGALPLSASEFFEQFSSKICRYFYVDNYVSLSAGEVEKIEKGMKTKHGATEEIIPRGLNR